MLGGRGARLDGSRDEGVGGVKDGVAEMVNGVLEQLRVGALDEALAKLLQQHRLAQRRFRLAHVCLHPFLLIRRLRPVCDSNTPHQPPQPLQSELHPKRSQSRCLS